MADIKMSIEDTVELDAIIKESTQVDSVISIDRDNTNYNLNGFQTHTGVFDPKDTGEFNITVNGQQLTVKVIDTNTIPNEGFEHNDLTGVYGGSTGDFSIQTGTVYEGAYALFGESNNSNTTILRKEGEKFSRLQDMKITWRQYPPSGSYKGSGSLFLATSVDKFNNLSGYYFYSDARSGNRNLRRIDNGSITNLDSADSGPSTDVWHRAELNLSSDGSMDFTIDGKTLSATDSTYKDVKIGFHSYYDVYFDDLRFS